jgi:hypothetical protein
MTGPRPTAGASPFRGETGQQPGDPRGAARAIIAALKREPAPQRLVLGAMAYGIPIAQLESMLAEIRENENTDEVSGLRRRRL